MSHHPHSICSTTGTQGVCSKLRGCWGTLRTSTRPTGFPEDSKSRIDVVWGGISWRTGEHDVGRGWMAERRSAREPGLSEHAARWTASMVMESGKPMRTLLLPARLRSLSAWLWRFHEGMEAGSQNAVTLHWKFWEMGEEGVWSVAESEDKALRASNASTSTSHKPSYQRTGLDCWRRTAPRSESFVSRNELRPGG
ncbi:hypothetical protein BS50DRAFT_261864 [Corynespora cassiicola Philippines]|uniref:Uncharacterized protein n=1 Tax=Corynespora cassiicola Philippines TaxID=1448308 RepID=A0A2T2N1C4_CORCC|nr:hypothetical protein BS50DRAFT_261864 [Corynespora cassiicola Philippines]